MTVKKISNFYFTVHVLTVIIKQIRLVICYIITQFSHDRIKAKTNHYYRKNAALSFHQKRMTNLQL